MRQVRLSRSGRPRWYHIGDVPLAEARKTIATTLKPEVARGNDPAAERRAARGAGTFAELHARYVEQHAKRKHKAWAWSAGLVRRYVLPRWGSLQANSLTRADARAMVGRIAAPALGAQVLMATSAVFSWA